MAYVVSVTNSSPGAVSSFTPTLPAHQTNDLILIFCSQDGVGSTETISATGWTTLAGSAASGGVQSSWVYKIAASGSETAPTIGTSPSNTDQWAVTILIIRDAHASPFGSSPASGTDYVQASWNAAWYADSGSLTTGADDCLLIYGCSMDTDNDSSVRMRTVPKDITLQTDYVETTNTAVRHMVGVVPAGASGSVAPVARFWFNNTASGTQQGGNVWTIAVRNKSGGKLQPAVKAGADVLRYYGHFNDTWADTWQAPSNFAGTIGALSVDTSISTGVATDLNNPPGTYTEIRSTLNTAGAFVGGSHAISSTDMDGVTFYVQWEIGSRARVGADGWVVGFSDGTNWAVYQLAAYSSSITIDAPLYNAIALGAGRATALYTSGTINWSAITRKFYGWHRDGSSASEGVMRIKNALLVGTAKFVGGSTTSPSKFSLLPAALEDCGYPDIANLQGTGQTMVRQDVQIGDGLTDTVFELSAQSLEYPQAFDATDAKKRKFNTLANAMTVGIYPSAADTLNITAGIMATAVQQALTVNASASTSATLSTAGSSFVGWTPTWKTGIACNSATFKQCAAIDFKGADITNVIVSDGTGTACATVSDGFSDTNGSYTASSTAVYGLRIAAAGTYSLDGTAFSGMTKDIDVTAASGTVTINLADGTATPTYQTAGATVTLVSSPVFQSVTISGLTTGSRVQIYDTTSSTELANEIASGTSVSWTDASPASASRAIRVKIAYVSGTTAKAFIEANIGTCGTSAGSEDVTYLANQVADSTYNTNAVNGETIYGAGEITFTDSSPDVINIDVSSNSVSLPNIYAAWVWYSFTEAGIATDIDYIDAVDPANYILSNMRIKNTSSPTAPLEITDGYAVDATTGKSVTLADTTGGTLVFAPDHVVAKVVSVGGSNIITGDIADIATASENAAAVLAAAATTPIAADIKKVLGTAIQTGSSSTASIGY